MTFCSFQRIRDQAEKLGGNLEKVLFCRKKDLDNSALELILPDGMLDYFDVTAFKKSASDYSIHLAEKNLFPAEFTGQSNTLATENDEVV